MATDLRRVHNRLTFPYLTPVDHSAQEWSRYVSDTPIEAAQMEDQKYDNVHISS